MEISLQIYLKLFLLSQAKELIWTIRGRNKFCQLDKIVGRRGFGCLFVDVCQPDISGGPVLVEEGSTQPREP